MKLKLDQSFITDNTLECEKDCYFLKEYLSFLKYEKNEEILQQSFRNLNGIFGNKNFTAYDLGFSIQNNDEPF